MDQKVRAIIVLIHNLFDTTLELDDGLADERTFLTKARNQAYKIERECDNLISSIPKAKPAPRARPFAHEDKED